MFIVISFILTLLKEKIVILGSERLLAKIRLGLDPGIQTFFKTLDSPIKSGNDSLSEYLFMDRH